ncbi:MAG TPA: nucleoside hydrolase [Candidatus Solibacter sp.]|nr:nucleoside hydrolase [Candidatus Solibacter sp.]
MLRLLAAALCLPSIWAAGRDSVIFDSDSGLFGDDGAALVMLLRSPAQVAVQGVTILPGNVWAGQGAEYVLHILDLLKRPQLPVLIGATQPLLHTSAMAKEAERRWGAIQYMGAFGMDPSSIVPAPGSKLSVRKPRRDAVAYMISEIEKRPGEITILAAGPMTNVALALRMRPDIETKIKRLVFMGGNVGVPGNSTPMAEFNFWFDPEAARIVLRSRIPHKIMFGLDICNQAPLHKAEFDQIANTRTPITALYREDFGNRYPAFNKNPNATAYMWDSLAAAYLIDPDFVTRYETRYLDVRTDWGQPYGAIFPLDRRSVPDATPVTVMLGLDFRRVFSLYKDRLTRAETVDAGRTSTER